MPRRRSAATSSSGKGKIALGNADMRPSILPSPSPLGPTTPPQDHEPARAAAGAPAPAPAPARRRSLRLNGEAASIAAPELPRQRTRRGTERKRKASESLKEEVSSIAIRAVASMIVSEGLPSSNGPAADQDGFLGAADSAILDSTCIDAQRVRDGLVFVHGSSSRDALAEDRDIEMQMEAGVISATPEFNRLAVDGASEVLFEVGEGSNRSHPSILEGSESGLLPLEEVIQRDLSSQALRMAHVEAEPENGGRRVRGRAEASRSRFLQIARDRAFHFAHFDADGDEAPAGAPPAARIAGGRHRGRPRRREIDPNPQPHAEPQEVDWPGPFSTARQLVNNRAMAAAARQNADAPGIKLSVVEWKPTRVLRDWNFCQRRCPSLQDLCLKVLAENAENVVSLEGVPDLVRYRISAAFCKCRKMTAKALSLFFEGNPCEVYSLDCTQVSEEELVQMMKQLCPGHLEKLHLEHCGRALSEQCLLNTIASPSTSTFLKSISFKGAYRLSDQGLDALLQASPQLVHLDLSNCSFLTNASVEAVARCVAGTLESLVLDGCRHLNASVFVNEIVRLTKLRKLSLIEVGGITDEVVTELCVQLGSTINELVLACCSPLSDAAVAAIGSCCSSLERLNLANLPALTDIAIAHIADNLRSLQHLNVNRCKLSDEAIATFVTASGGSLLNLSLNSVQKVAGQTIMALARHSRASLEILDLSFCRLVDDECLGFLADNCFQLKELRLFGCTQVTDKFLYGHSNSNLNVVGLSCSH